MGNTTIKADAVQIFRELRSEPQTIVDLILSVERITEGEFRVSPRRAYGAMDFLESSGYAIQGEPVMRENARGRNRATYMSTEKKLNPMDYDNNLKAKISAV